MRFSTQTRSSTHEFQWLLAVSRLKSKALLVEIVLNGGDRLSGKRIQSFEKMLQIAQIRNKLTQSTKLSSTYPNLRINLETIRLILVLLNLASDLCDFPSLAEIDKLRVAQKVGVALLNVQNVCQIHPEEWNAWRID